MSGSDRMKSALEAFITRLVGKYDYAGCYTYTVVSQGSDGTVDLKPDATSKVPGLTGVSICYGTPAETIQVNPGARCRVMFENQDPSKPFVLGWEHGSYTTVTLGDGGAPVARVGDTVACFFPPTVPFTGTVGGAPAVGVMTIIMPVSGVIQGGNAKVLA